MNTMTSSARSMESPKADKTQKNWIDWLRRIFRWLVVVLLVLIATGLVYQRIGATLDARNFPPPGQLVDVGGYRLHIHCMGEASVDQPTVILEALSGGMSPYWAWVQPEVAKTTRVCAYDRAGRAWSEPSPQPPDLTQIGHDLHTLLQNANVAGPYVLVGHSIGGLYVRQFAADYPDEVVGMVLLDAAHPEQYVRHPEMLAAHEDYVGFSAWFAPLAHLGVFRLYFATGGEIDFQDLPARQHDEVAAFWSSPGYFRSQRAENSAALAIYEQAQHLGDLGDLTLMVVSAGTETPAGWSELQTELAQLSTNSAHQTLDSATHVSLTFNPQDAQMTSASILKVVEAVRSGQPLQP